jgi:ribulose bisphosphate carboxylase small subunit
MDIEILRDIAEQVRHNYEQGHAIGFNLDDHCYYELAYGLKSMLDAEIARQSVSDEAVRDAIEELSQLSDRAHYSQDGGHVKHMVSLKTIDQSITALRQMRTEPCEWQLSCGYEEFEEHITGCGVVFTFIGDEMKNIHYCPNCGRKLVTE